VRSSRLTLGQMIERDGLMPQAVRTAARAVLGQGRYRANVERLRAEMRALPDLAHGVALLERLAVDGEDRHLRAAIQAGIIERADASLLEIIDHVLNKGVMLQGEVILGVAGVDLVYLRLNALLCAADRLLPARDRK